MEIKQLNLSKGDKVRFIGQKGPFVTAPISFSSDRIAGRIQYGDIGEIVDGHIHPYNGKYLHYNLFFESLYIRANLKKGRESLCTFPLSELMSDVEKFEGLERTPFSFKERVDLYLEKYRSIKAVTTSRIILQHSGKENVIGPNTEISISFQEIGERPSGWFSIWADDYRPVGYGIGTLPVLGIIASFEVMEKSMEFKFD